jgi:hypothetical protein
LPGRIPLGEEPNHPQKPMLDSNKKRNAASFAEFFRSLLGQAA